MSEGLSPIPGTADIPDAEKLLHDGTPDWDAIGFDVLCSRCAYNLKTLTAPRCPECGLEFVWRDVIGVGSAGNSLLFEYAWRRKPLRAWLWTAMLGLFPGRFWRRVPVHAPPRRGPLVAMLALAIPGSLIVFHVIAYLLSLPEQAWSWLEWTLLEHGTLMPGSPFLMARLSWALEEVATEPFDEWSRNYWLVPVLMFLGVLVWVAMLGGLARSRSNQSMSGAYRLRVAAYTITPALFLTCGVWLLLVMAGAWPEYYYEWQWNWPGLEVCLAIGAIVMGLPCAILGFYTSRALSLHARIDRPWLVGLAISALVFLTIFTAWVANAAYLGDDFDWFRIYDP